MYRIAALSLLVLAAAPVAAQQAAPAPDQATAGVPAPFAAEQALDGDALGQVAGREDVGAMIARADQRNTVAGNSVTGNSVTGSVAIDGNAFQNIQGMAVVSANSGNNVAMNAAMNVVINVAPPR